MKTFDLEILTPQGIKYQGAVEKLALETQDGRIGVLARHCRYFALMAPGVTVIKGPKPGQLLCGEGIFRIADDKAVILTDFARVSEEIAPLPAKNTVEEISEKLRKFEYKNYEEQQKLRNQLRIARLEIKLGQGGN